MSEVQVVTQHQILEQVTNQVLIHIQLETAKEVSMVELREVKLLLAQEAELQI